MFEYTVMLEIQLLIVSSEECIMPTLASMGFGKNCFIKSCYLLTTSKIFEHTELLKADILKKGPKYDRLSIATPVSEGGAQFLKLINYKY